MQRLKIVLVFISLYLLRLISLPSPLPVSWTPESQVRFTAPIIDQPEHNDTKTIIRSGIWVIEMTGYAEIMPGSLVSFVGKAQPQVLLTKVVKIVMKDPTFEVVRLSAERKISWGERGLITLGKWRQGSVAILEKWLSEPMSSLAAGILLGVKGQMPRDFYQALVKTGTLHVVAASGYNVAVVASAVTASLGRVMSRGGAITLGILAILLYVIVAGGSASVVRAGIMGSLTLISYYFGRPAEAKRLLWVTAMIMLLVEPLMIMDVGFQLSVAATAGLLYLEPWIRAKLSIIPGIVGEYLFPTLAAMSLTTPIIYAYFGRISWIAPLANLLILPMVPLIMLLAAITLVLQQPAAWILYVPLYYVISVIRWLS